MKIGSTLPHEAYQKHIIKPVEPTSPTNNNGLYYKLMLTNTERQEHPDNVSDTYKSINIYV